MASLVELCEGVEGVGLVLGVLGVVTVTGRGVGGPSVVLGFFLGGGDGSSTSSAPSSAS